MTALFVFARVVLVLIAVVHSLPQKGGKNGGNRPDGQNGGIQPGSQNGGNRPGGQNGGSSPGGQNGGGQRVTGEAGSAVGSRGDFWHRFEAQKCNICCT